MPSALSQFNLMIYSMSMSRLLHQTILVFVFLVKEHSDIQVLGRHQACKWCISELLVRRKFADSEDNRLKSSNRSLFDRLTEIKSILFND